MQFTNCRSLCLVSLLAWHAHAQAEAVVQEVPDDDPSAATKSPTANVQVKTYFPNSEVFGVKLVNGHATQAVLSILNHEVEPIRVQVVGGSLWDLATKENIRNLTAIPYNVDIPAGQNQSLTYNIKTELHPQDLTLVLAAVVSKGGNGFQIPAFNGTVSIVEAPISIFDPQMLFLYLFLSAVFAGTCYFIYSTWIATLFPQKRRGGKGGERASKSSKGSKRVDPSDQIAVGGADGPAVTSGAQAFDSSWIDPIHLKRPEARRVGSGRPNTPKSRAK